MKKRFFGVLLALAALGLMAGSAMAEVNIKFTLNGTVGSETTPSFSEEISFSADDVALIKSSDIDLNKDINSLVDPKTGLISRDIVAATGPITISSSSDTIKFTTGGDDAKVLNTLPDGSGAAFFTVENADDGEEKVEAKDSSKVKGIEHSTTLYVPVQIKQKVEAESASLAADEEYEDFNEGECVVYVKIKVNFKVVIDGVGEVELPRALNGRQGTYRLWKDFDEGNDLTDAQRKALEAKEYGFDPADLNLFLNKTIANDFGHSVDDANIGNGQASIAQVKAVAKSGVQGIMAVLDQLKTANPNTSAYVIALIDLSDEIKAAVADGTFNMYFLNLTKKAANTSVAASGEAEPADDALFYIYDADSAEFRAPDEGDKYEVLFVAFDREPGTFQPFFATGVAPNPSGEPEVTPTPTATPEPGPETTPTPGADVTPTPTSSGKKSSGSSGCDMGMVSGIAILLAALLPLRKVRK